MFGAMEIGNDKWNHHRRRFFRRHRYWESISSQQDFFRRNKQYIFFDFKVKPLHLKLAKTSTYTKSYDGQTKWMYFLIEDDDLLQKHDTWY